MKQLYTIILNDGQVITEVTWNSEEQVYECDGAVYGDDQVYMETDLELYVDEEGKVAARAYPSPPQEEESPIDTVID